MVPKTDFFIPDGSSLEVACKKVTHLGIGAHQDDLEIMALHGILACYKQASEHFGAIICTNGGGSPRLGCYALLNDHEMIALRCQEQRKAAVIGEYAVVAQLGYSSSVIKKTREDLVKSLCELLLQMQPEIIYTHNPLDSHATHISVFLAVVEALRTLPPARRPKNFLGCEVWRSLDWLPHEGKISLDVSRYPELSKKLIRSFDSQIAGGKRYDHAMIGRYHANATFADPHQTDEATMILYAMDLMPLLEDETKDIADYALGFIDRFRNEAASKFAEPR